MRHVLAGAVALAALLLAAPAATGGGPTVEQMAGQLLLVRMRGTTPSASFVRRVERGQIGGVVLFTDNFPDGDPGPLVEQLQAAAAAGHQPKLLIAIDQEGGEVKRLAGAPSLAPPQMRTPAIARAQGLATARNLRSLGIDVDLAPVLDVDHGGFIGPRTFGSTPLAVRTRGNAFAAGLAAGHVLATAKHFPGLGYAKLNTDDTVSVVRASAAKLERDWLPYRVHGVPLVMMSTAIYPALRSHLPAAVSPRIVRLLRTDVGFSGAIVTDALQTPEVNHYFTTAQAAVRAVAAGCDLVMAAGPTSSRANTDVASTTSYAAIVAAARSGRLPRAVLRAAYRRVLILKSRP